MNHLYYICIVLVSMLCTAYSSTTTTSPLTKQSILNSNRLALDVLSDYKNHTLQQISSSISILKTTKSTQSIEATLLCSYIDSIVNDKNNDIYSNTPANVQNLYYIVNINGYASCKYNVHNRVIDLLNYGITSNYLPNLYYTVQIIELLTNNNKIKSNQLNTQELKQAVPLLFDLIDSKTGSSRLSSETTETTIYGTALNIYTLATLYKLVDKQHTTYSTQYNTLIKYCESLLATIVDINSNTVDIPQSHLPSYITQLSAISNIVTAITTFGSITNNGLKLNNQHVNIVASYMLTNGISNDVNELHYVLDSIYSMSNNNAIQNIPVILSVHDVNGDKLSVKITNTINEPVNNLRVSITGDNLSTKQLKYTNDGVYELSNHGLKRGLYNVQFNVDSTDSNNKIATINNFQRTIVITDKFNGASVNLLISKTKPINHIQYPKSVTQPQLTADATKTIQLTLTLKDTTFTPQTLLALLTHNSTTVLRYLFTQSNDNKNTYTATINLGSSLFIEHSVGSGFYDIDVLIGDITLDNPVQWHISSIDITLPDTSTLPHRRTHSDLYKQLPEIYHIFPAAEKRPNKLVAAIFSILSFIPLCGLLYYILPILTSIQLPTQPTELLSSTIFIGSIGAILFIYVLYWLRLNIFTALLLTGLVSLVGLFSGTQTLRLLATRQQLQQSSKKID